MSKKVDAEALQPIVGSLYPPSFNEPCLSRKRKRLGDAAGLNQFGVNLLLLPPGASSSQRHWQTEPNEFVYVLSGDLTLMTDAGPELLAGNAAGFKAGDPNRHCLLNSSDRDALMLEIGTRLAGDGTHYPDVDMVAPTHGKPARYTRRDGTPFADSKRQSVPVGR